MIQNNLTKGPLPKYRTPSAVSAGTGGLNDEQFETEFKAAFEEVPDIKVSSWHDLKEECQKHTTILENTDSYWGLQLKALQSLRSIIKNPCNGCESFIEQPFSLVGQSLITAVECTRSQVCKEACITIAFYAIKLGTEFWKIAESVLPITLNLCQNSAKVMAWSGQNANLYIVKHVHHPKILCIVMQHFSHKAKPVRNMVITLIANIINTWESNILDKHWTEIMDVIKSAGSDADPETRKTAVQAFINFHNSYPEKADMLFPQLPPNFQRRILAEQSSTASSTRSINSERDNLPNSKLGLYNRQEAYLGNRSRSDMNPPWRKNIPQKCSNRPNLVRAKPPVSPVPKPISVMSATPTSKKVLNEAPTAASKIVKREVVSPHQSSSTPLSKSTSQPGSRNTSPSRSRQLMQQVRSHIPTQAKANGSVASTPVRPLNYVNHNLKNSDNHHKGIRPNVVRTDRRNLNGENISPQKSSVPESPLDFYGLSSSQQAALSRMNNSQQNNSMESKHSLSVEHPRNSDGLQSSISSESPTFIAPNQDLLINDICDLLLRFNENSDAIYASGSYTPMENDFENALQNISRLIREGLVESWDECFNKILHSILTVLSNSHSSAMKVFALRALRDLCIAQPRRLSVKTDLVLMKVLNSLDGDDATVGRAAEDCGIAFISGLSTQKCLQLLSSIIDDDKSKCYQLSGAIKMLGHLITMLDRNEVLNLIPNLAPKMVKCYENSQSMVRRAAILCLVSISNSTGIEEMSPYLSQPTTKLVEVYRQRMARK